MFKRRWMSAWFAAHIGGPLDAMYARIDSTIGGDLDNTSALNHTVRPAAGTSHAGSGSHRDAESTQIPPQ